MAGALGPLAGSAGAASTVVAGAPTPDGTGAWLVTATGAVSAVGAAPQLGGLGGVALDQPIVGIAATPSGRGYWLVASDGGVFAFGDARFAGSTGSMHLDRPIVGMASTPDGGGYWLVAGDGGVFSFGDARFEGSTGGVRLDAPVVGMAATHDGGGYWLLGADGGVFAFGSAPFGGSPAGTGPAVGIGAGPSGYEVVTATGALDRYAAGGFTASAVSGAPMPVGDLPGWHQTFADDFTGTALDPTLWGNPFAGEPGGDPAAWWDPSQVTVGGGLLTLSTTYTSGAPNGAHWVSGGISLRDSRAQAYGKYELRMRGDAAYGVADIAMLWPVSGWPPEIDFYEDGWSAAGTRTGTSATVHWDGANYTFQVRQGTIDFTHWHTVGVEWTPGSIVYTVDGAPWATVTTTSIATAGSPDAANAVPSSPMVLHLQSQALQGWAGSQTPGRSAMQVDWVVGYSPA
ncbi:MAG TPA: glycoside hydrolase family 16 protein [Acidimicrobiales bacterium]|nr:glycoside hydrolase family 16 protein [Acidimicrobiales bacterium]